MKKDEQSHYKRLKTVKSVNSLDDNYVSDEELLELTQMDSGQKSHLNLAGPLFKKTAYEHVRRISGDNKERRHPLKPKYIREDILERIKELEEEFKKEHEEQNGPMKPLMHQEKSTDENSSLYYAAAMNKINRLKSEQNLNLRRMLRNFKLFAVMAVVFAVYYFFTVNHHDDIKMSVEGLQSKLPIRIDNSISLNRLSYDNTTLTMQLLFKKGTLLHHQAPSSALDLYIKSSATKICKIPLFFDMISSGKVITVYLDAEDGSFHEIFSVDRCGP